MQTLSSKFIYESLRNRCNSRARRYLDVGEFSEMKSVAKTLTVLILAHSNEEFINVEEFGPLYRVDDYSIPTGLNITSIVSLGKVYFNEPAKAIQEPVFKTSSTSIEDNLLEGRVLTPEQFEFVLQDLIKTSNLDWTLTKVNKEKVSLSDFDVIYVPTEHKDVYNLIRVGGSKYSEIVTQCLGVKASCIMFDENIMRYSPGMAGLEVRDLLFK